MSVGIRVKAREFVRTCLGTTTVHARRDEIPKATLECKALLLARLAASTFGTPSTWGFTWTRVLVADLQITLGLKASVAAFAVAPWTVGVGVEGDQGLGHDALFTNLYARLFVY